MPGINHQSSSIHAARVRAACTLLFLALGLLASWDLPEAGIRIPVAPLTLFLLAALLAAASLVISLPGRVSSHRVPGVCLCAAVFVFALGWGQLKLREPTGAGVASLIAGSEEPPIFRLTVLTNPRSKPGSDSWSCLARLRAFVADSGSTPINQDVWLSARSDSVPKAGDRVIVRATFRPVEPPRNPGEFDLRRYATDRGIAGSVHVSSALLIRPDESPAPLFESALNSYRRVLGALRERAGSTVDSLGSRASPDAQQLLRGLLLGENPSSPSDGLASFYQLGLAHILSISGFHLMVFAAAALFSLRLLGDLGRLEPLMVGAVILLFLAIVPASSPLVRAATILLVLLVAECLGRRYDRLTLLCWTAVGILVYRPSELWSLGFQLSFGLTGALLGLAPRLSLRLFPPPLGVRPRINWFWARARGTLIALVVTGVLCWALSAPWIASNVGIFNPLAIVTGIVVTPIIVLALWIGYAALLFGLAFPPIAEFASVPIGAVADLAVATAGWWDSIPVAVIRLPPLSQAWGLATTTLLALWFVRARLRIPHFAAIAFALFAWAALEAGFGRRLPADLAARVYLLDESPASCTIIRTPNQSIMFNAGTSSPQAQGRDLAEVARRLGAWRLDSLIIDARDPRAASGAPEVIRALRPDTLVLVGESDPDSAHLHSLIARARAFGAHVRFASTLGDVLESLPPPLRHELPVRSATASRGMTTLDYPKWSQ